jgi:hypothetical protein
VHRHDLGRIHDRDARIIDDEARRIADQRDFDVRFSDRTLCAFHFRGRSTVAAHCIDDDTQHRCEPTLADADKRRQSRNALGDHDVMTTNDNSRQGGRLRSVNEERLLFGVGLRDDGLAAILAATHADAVRNFRRAAVGAGLNRRTIFARLLHPRRALMCSAGWAATSFLQCHDRTPKETLCARSGGQFQALECSEARIDRFLAAAGACISVDPALWA